MASMAYMAPVWVTSVVVSAALGAVATMQMSDHAFSANAPASALAAVELGNGAKTMAAEKKPATSLSRQRDGLFYVTAAVNGHPVRFIVDTGASMVVLSKVDALGSGVSTGQAIAATTANGISPMYRARIARLDIAGRRLGDVPAMVASQGDISLIGQNVLGMLDQVVIEGDRLRLR